MSKIYPNFSRWLRKQYPQRQGAGEVKKSAILRLVAKIKKISKIFQPDFCQNVPGMGVLSARTSYQFLRAQNACEKSEPNRKKWGRCRGREKKLIGQAGIKNDKKKVDFPYSASLKKMAKNGLFWKNHPLTLKKSYQKWVAVGYEKSTFFWAIL